MARICILLSEAERAGVAAVQLSHPDLHVRRKILILGSVQTGLTRLQAAKVADVGRATVQRYLAEYRDGGLEGLRRWGVVGPVSELAVHADTIKAALNETPVRAVAEAADRIEQLTGLHRGLTQTCVFLKDLGLRWQRTRALPAPPKKSLTEHVATQREFLTIEFQAALDAAQAGNGHVFFVEAARFVFGTFLC